MLTSCSKKIRQLGIIVSIDARSKNVKLIEDLSVTNKLDDSLSGLLGERKSYSIIFENRLIIIGE